MSAPEISIVDGMASWTIDTQPESWILLPCFADGSLSHSSIMNCVQLAGDVDHLPTVFVGAGWYLKLYGISGTSLTLLPTLSSDST